MCHLVFHSQHPEVSKDLSNRLEAKRPFTVGLVVHGRGWTTFVENFDTSASSPFRQPGLW